MAHAPGAMECPSDRAAVGGRPRTRTKLLLGSAPGGPTAIGNGTWAAGWAAMAAATVIEGRGLDWARAGLLACTPRTRAVAPASKASTKPGAWPRRRQSALAVGAPFTALPSPLPWCRLVAGGFRLSPSHRR